MKGWDYISLANILYLLSFGVHHALGGVCWESVDDSSHLCRKALRLNMTLSECCQMSGLASQSWSPHEKASDIFYLNYLSDGADMCQRCHKNCATVNCGQGQSCRMNNGLPVCVCKPRCDAALKSRGYLCGSDGRRYRNYCALQRYNCVNERQISVEYFGKCKKSCRKVKCENGKRCLQDQNGMPHCVYCDTKCNQGNFAIPDDPSKYMCGENGRTYKSTCELKADICKEGRSIRIAYFGKCSANETCDSLKCPEGTKCLVTVQGGRPLCMNCDMSCVQSIKVPVCGTDRQNYPSYCHMLNAGCRTGVYISTYRGGTCKNKRRYRVGSKDKTSTKTIGADKIETVQLEHGNSIPRKKHKQSARRNKTRRNRQKYRNKQMWQAYRSANFIALSEAAENQSKLKLRGRLKNEDKESNTS